MNAATASRLNALKDLGKGWDSYGADPISHEAIERAHKLLEAMTAAPLIFPTVDGGIELMWGDEMVTLTIHDDRCELYVEGLEE